MSTKNLTYSIGADLDQLRRDMDAAGTLTRRWQRELDSLEAKQRVHRQTLEDVGRGYATFGTAAILGLGVATKAAMDWETAFTGVKKTVDGSDKDFANLEGQLRQLARTLPAAHEEIAGVAEAAGQLGIKRKDIAAFTQVMIDLGNTTNLTAEDAAAELAKFSNIMGTSASDVDRLGSALVALGNDGASTEADILAMALRIAGAGHTVGLTEAQVLAFASALSSVGINAEAGGSAISRVMVTIESAVRSGGKAVQGFADVAGMSGDEFVKAYKQDAAGAIITFISGLNRMQTAGGNVFKTLDDLGFGEIIVRDALLRAAGASDMFTHSLQVGSSAWAENQALTEEASKRYETSASKLQVAANVVKDTLIDVGALIGPIAVKGAQAIGDIVAAFQALPAPVREVVVWVGAGAAVITLFGGAALIAAPKVLAFRESMDKLISTGGGVSTALGRMGLFLSGPWGAAIGAAVTVLALFAAKSGEASRQQQNVSSSLREAAKAMAENNGAIDESIRKTIAKAAADKKWADGSRNVLTAGKDLGVQTGMVTDAILNQGNAYDKLKAQLEGIVRAGAAANSALKKGEFVSNADRDLANRAGAAQVLLGKLGELRGEYSGYANAEKEVAGAAKQSTAAAKGQAAATDEVTKSSEEASKALDDLLKAFNALNGVTLTYREAQRDYVEAVNAANEALGKNGKNLDINTQAGRDNQKALDGQAKAANDLAEAAAREAEKTGGSAAGLAAFTASLQASRPELIKMAQSFGMSEEAAKAYANQVLGIPGAASTTILTPGSAQALAELVRVRDAVKNVPPNKEINVGVLSQSAIDKLNELGYKTKTLPDGTVVVTSNTKPAQDGLDSYIDKNTNRRLTVVVDYATGGRAQGIQNAFGGVVAFAGGGTWENHRPQVAKAVPGTVRVWAEEDTDRESYIPWARDRRPQAVGVLGYTADEFGYALVPKSQMAMGDGRYYGAAPAAAGGAAAGQQTTVTVPQTLVIVDADGQLVGRMRVEARGAMAEESRNFYLAGGGG